MRRNTLSIVLLQLRNDRVMREHERKCILRAGALASSQLTAVNGLEDELKSDEVFKNDALIIGGSGDYSVFADLPFIEDLGEILNKARQADFPVLGSCWGGQFMAQHFGGEVQTRQDMEEVGTFSISLSSAAKRDPLFFDFPNEFLAQLGHHESIVKAPPGAIILAKSDKCPIQAFTWKNSAQYALQFHPELGRRDVEHRILHYKKSYANEPGALERALGGLRESPLTENLVGKFIDRVIRPA